MNDVKIEAHLSQDGEEMILCRGKSKEIPSSALDCPKISLQASAAAKSEPTLRQYFPLILDF